MKTSRAEKLAGLVLDYSIKLKNKDKLLIQFEPSYTLYANLMAGLAEAKGAEVRFDNKSFDAVYQRSLIARKNPEEWSQELERRINVSRWCNTRVLIDTVNAITNAVFDKEVIGPYKEVLYRPGKHLGFAVRWNLTGFPSRQRAKSAGMSFEDYENFVYEVTLGNNWQEMSKQMANIKSAFDNAKEVHVFVSGLTDLHFSLDDRKGEICDGKINMPDGEVCYGPVENSVEGKVYFQCPTKKGDDVLEEVRLEFEKGLVIKSSARKNERVLKEYLEIADGTRRIGELGIGGNYAIKRPTLEILFDEKIGGTIHLALGSSCSTNLSNGGGLNPQNLPHWDILCDLRKDTQNLPEFPGGEIYVDGRLVQKNGRWKI